MGKTRQWRCGAKAGAALLIALAMVCSVFMITGEPAFAKAAKPGKIKTSTVKRVKATETSMTVSFGKAKNATKYQVRYQKDGEKNWKSKTTKKQTVTLKSLEKYTMYNVQVRGLAGKKAGAWTKAKTFTTLGDEHLLMFDPGENATLKKEEQVRTVRAGQELGEFPMPELKDGDQTILAWFALWYTDPFDKGKEVYENTLMGDEDLVIYAKYKFDSNGDTDSDPVFKAEDQYFPGDLEIDGKDEVILKDVTVYGHLIITDTKKVTIDNVRLQLGKLKISGKKGNNRCELVHMKGVTLGRDMELYNVNAGEVSDVTTSYGILDLYECDIKTLRNVSFYEWGDDTAALDAQRTRIELMDQCTFHSCYYGINLKGNPGLWPDEMIKTMKDSYVYGKEMAIFLSWTSYIGTIDNSVLISKGEECIRSDIGNRGPIREFKGDTIIYCESGVGVLTLEINGPNVMRIEPGITENVGKVRIYGPGGVDSEKHGRLIVPSGYHMENSDPAYNSLDNSRIAFASDANFVGKKFYYLKKND